MDFPSKKFVPNPSEDANIFSHLVFHWMLPILGKGSRNTLNFDDLYNVLDGQKAEFLGNQLESAWISEESLESDSKKTVNFIKKRRFKLLRALLTIHWKRLTFLSMFSFLDECVIRIAQPLLVRSFIRSFTDAASPEDTRYDQYFYGIGLGLVTLIHAVAMHLIFYHFFALGSKCRIALSSLIYRKVLRVSRNGQQQTSLGQLMNLLSTDVSIDFEFGLSIYTVVGPIQFCILSYLLWTEFGYAAFAGIGCILILSPIQYCLNIFMRKLREKIAKATDKRANAMNEIIGAIRIIKMYAWEYLFAKLIARLRGDEIKIIRHKSLYLSCILSLFNFSSKIIVFCIVLAFVLCGNTLTADKVFFATTIGYTMMQLMMLLVPESAGGMVEIFVKLKRIETMLRTTEQNASNARNCENKHGKLDLLHRNIEDFTEKELGNARLEMRNVTASWTFDKKILKNISTTLKSNQLVMIVGSVGSGKTSFLNVLLNELSINEGECHLNRSTLSYTPQEAWLFPGTIRQNIIYDQPFNQDHYQTIIHACALEQDLSQFPASDLARIGDSRLVLSGGQKTRISIARSMYRDADVYLFDDPLSSVDTRVGQHIFENCFVKLLEGKLRILVTHQLQYLSKADHIIVLDHGEILAQGTFSELESGNPEFQTFLASNMHQENLEPNKFESNGNLKAKIFEDKERGEAEEGNKEAIMAGSVRGTTYWKYFQNGGSSCLIFVLLFGFLCNQILHTFGDVWLSIWANMEANRAGHGVDLAVNDTSSNSNIIVLSVDLEPREYFIVYSCIIVTMVLGFLTVGTHFFHFAMEIGVNMHDQVFRSLIRAPMSFFEMNPSGRILNRFTKDLHGIDEFLPCTVYEIIQILFQNLCILFIVVLSNYYMLFPTLVMFLLMYLIRGYYMKTARYIKRFEATARSPLLVHLNATYQGLTTIRALNSQSRLISEFHAHQDIHSSAWLIHLASARWFALWLEIICVSYLICAICGFLFLTTSISAGNVGLAISSILALMGSFQWAMRQSVELPNLMTSVERIFEYCSIEPEPPLEPNPESKPPANWPSRGEICFESVSLTYNNSSSTVLNDISFQIAAGEKVGICGRTGAGKSSLISTLFRMADTTGKIYIDNICINVFGLHDLRKNISIIPQDPILFTGSIRYNLDPFEEFDDHDLWQVLEEVELKQEVSSLDFEITEGGNNFSVGQKQLICLARALLRKNKIIVLDEATANTDLRTDQLIQATIRKKFTHCTMLTVAHRLHTILDCDRILVLENGYLVENDAPDVLLRNPKAHVTDGLLAMRRPQMITDWKINIDMIICLLLLLASRCAFLAVNYTGSLLWLKMSVHISGSIRQF